MTIECEYCNEEVWCLRQNDGDEWICKQCFISEHFGDNQDWYNLNEQAKRERQKKRMAEFDEF